MVSMGGEEGQPFDSTDGSLVTLFRQVRRGLHAAFMRAVKVA